MAFQLEGHDAVLSKPWLDRMARVQVMAEEHHWSVGWGLGLELYRRGDRIFAGPEAEDLLGLPRGALVEIEVGMERCGVAPAMSIPTSAMAATAAGLSDVWSAIRLSPVCQ